MTMTDDEYQQLERRARHSVTHHAACDCGEWMRAKMEREHAVYREIVQAVANIQLAGRGDAVVDALPYDAQISAVTITIARALLVGEQRGARA